MTFNEWNAIRKALSRIFKIGVNKFEKLIFTNWRYFNEEI